MSPSTTLPASLVDLVPDDLQTGVAFLAAYAAATWATPVVIRACVNFGIVDRPDGRLKRHEQPVPSLGGLAVALGVLVALGLTYQFDHQVLATLLAASTVMIIGLLDDLGSLRPWSKLAGQLLAALVLVKAGVYIRLEFLPVWVAVPLTVLWVLAVTNAINLLDIVDGLAAGVSAAAALGLAVVAWVGDAPSTAFLAVALAGALLGFRRFNAAPARIYLGDTGSLLSGFLLASIAVVNDYTETTPVGALAPVLILGVPLFDTVFVMVVRRAKGIPVMRGSPDHLALRIRRAGWSTAATSRLGWIASAGVAAAGAALPSMSTRWAWTTFGVASAVALAVAVAGALAGRARER